MLQAPPPGWEILFGEAQRLHQYMCSLWCCVGGGGVSRTTLHNDGRCCLLGQEGLVFEAGEA